MLTNSAFFSPKTIFHFIKVYVAISKKFSFVCYHTKNKDVKNLLQNFVLVKHELTF